MGKSYSSFCEGGGTFWQNVAWQAPRKVIKSNFLKAIYPRSPSNIKIKSIYNPLDLTCKFKFKFKFKFM